MLRLIRRYGTGSTVFTAVVGVVIAEAQTSKRSTRLRFKQTGQLLREPSRLRCHLSCNCFARLGGGAAHRISHPRLDGTSCCRDLRTDACPYRLAFDETGEYALDRKAPEEEREASKAVAKSAQNTAKKARKM